MCGQTGNLSLYPQHVDRAERRTLRLFELYRFVTERGGSMKIVGLQPRVYEMASMVGLTSAFEVFPREDLALGSAATNREPKTGSDRTGAKSRP